MTRKMLREWLRSRSQTGPKRVRGGRRLSAEPFSYKYLVANIITTTPVQSAIALPKNEPIWVRGLETLYRQIHKMRILAEAMLKREPGASIVYNLIILALCWVFWTVMTKDSGARGVR